MSMFKLLQLPFVALRHVLRFLNPIDLFIMSHCSNKAMLSVSAAGTNQFHLAIKANQEIVINQEYKFLVKTMTIWYEREHPGIECEKLGAKGLPNVYNMAKIKLMFPRDVENPMLKVVVYLMKIFQCRIKRFEVEDQGRPGEHSLISKAIIEHQGNTIEELRVDLATITKQEFTELQKQFVVSKELEIYGGRPQDFKSYTFPQHPKVIRVGRAPWATLRKLSSLINCSVIYISDSQLTSRDVEGFLKMWQAGKFPKLEIFHVTSYKFTGNESFLGFPAGQLNARRRMRMKKAAGYRRTCLAGRDIQADDGTKATIQYKGGRFPQFMLLIWRD